MQLNNLTWSDRLALINTYNPPPAVACDVFGITLAEFQTAKELHAAGTFVANDLFDVEAYESIFAKEILNAGISSPNSYNKPETSTKRSESATPNKRGRKGNNIITALLAVPTTPVLMSLFTKQYNVSVAVLRQSKRFISTQSEDIQKQMGTICVKQDRVTKELMVWKVMN